jgi:hypothetical protein
MAMAVSADGVILIVAIRSLPVGTVDRRFDLPVRSGLRLASRRIDGAAHQQRYQNQERGEGPKGKEAKMQLH